MFAGIICMTHVKCSSFFPWVYNRETCKEIKGEKQNNITIIITSQDLLNYCFNNNLIFLQGRGMTDKTKI